MENPMTKKKPTKSQNIRDYVINNPKATVSEVAKALDMKYQTVYMAKRAMEKKLGTLWSPPKLLPMPMPITMHEPKADPVNHPAHYKVGGIETIDFIEAKKLSYNMGNAVKYITRADHKGNRKQDLEKALWYIQRELTHTS
jgi:hypothetical protein